MSTIAFPAHPDDDLLFMNPDIAAGIQSGEETWVAYLTAGDIPYRAGKTYGDMAYADMRINGVRDAYARAAKTANVWLYEPLTVAGRTVATNRLIGTRVRLVFLFIHAAANPEDPHGDLYRLWTATPDGTVQPIDGTARYSRTGFITLIRGLLELVKPTAIRSTSTIGHQFGDHVDHTSAALFVAEANTDARSQSIYTRIEYTGYATTQTADNLTAYWAGEKTAIWDAYWPHDPELTATDWRSVLTKQDRPEARTFPPGSAWSPPTDF